MESFLPSEIARLVLGYLEDHSCEEAYETFLRTSTNLEECFKMREEGRKFRTEVMGLKLLDILYEYSAIFSLVEERLKRVDPETASSLKKSGSLLDKITFLLNATISGQTMLFSITLPPGKSPSTSAVAHVRKRSRISSTSDKKKGYFRKHSRAYIDEFSPIVELDENSAKPSTLETTSLSSLPGNSTLSLDRTEHLEGTSSSIVRTPKRKTIALNSSRRSRSNSEMPEETEENLDITALTKALLDNHVLHEKIAENINKVICTPELAAGSNVSQLQDLCSAQNPTLLDTNTTLPNNFTFELDDAIKKIVEETESDPVFENFLQDVVCPADETSEEGEERGISDTSTPCQSTPETVKKIPLKHRLRSSKKRLDSPITSSSEINSPTKIDHQNAAAIESIISIQSKPIEPEPSTSGLQGKPSSSKEIDPKKVFISDLGLTQSTNTQPLTVQTSSVDNIILFEEQKNDNRNLLIAQPSTPYIITESLNYQPPMQDNRLVILSSKMTQSGSQILTVQPAHLQTSVYAEDILTMPTVIINNEQNPGNSFVVPHKIFPTLGSTTAVSQPPPPPKVYRNPLILPHTNISNMSAETITYTFNVQPQPMLTTTTDNAVPIDSSNPKPSTSKQVEETVVSSKQVKETVSGSKQIEGTAAGSLPMIPTSSGKKEDKTEEQKPVTPERSDKKVQRSLTTPRTVRSHIRTLDFSSPPKEHPTRKPLTSPKILRTGKVTKTPKQSRANLFSSPVNLPIATRTPRAKLQGDWDGSELIFVSNKSPRKSKSSERSSVDAVKEDKDENNSAKRQRVNSINNVSDKPLVIDETVMVKIETKKEIPPKPRTKKAGSWDQDLRVHIEPIAASGKRRKSPVKRKKRTKVSEENVETQDIKEISNKTEEEGLTIEAELAKIENHDSSKENIVSPNEIEKTETKESENKPTEVKPAKATKRRRQTKTKNPPNPEPLKIEVPKIKLEEITGAEEAVEDNTEQNKEPTESMLNMIPRVKKKCNINSAKKSVTNENKQKTKAKNKAEEIKTVKVLSPSKMNANKRIFVEQDKPEVNKLQTTTNLSNKPSISSEIKSDEKIFVEHENPEVKDPQTTTKPSIEPSTSIQIQSDGQSLITPDIMKPSCSNAITAKRNIIPMLETPLKDESLMYPATPRLLTPFGTDASLTTLLKENCGTADLSSIMTPTFPMTPSFPLTPGLGTGDTHSSYSSRPTDYSNSSSYYQPSDSEQNQKIDQVLIEEAMKIEACKLTKKLWTSTPDKEAILLANRELSIPPNDTMPNSAGDIICKSTDTVEKLVNQTIDATNTSVDFCKTDSETSTSSSSDADQTKENLNIEIESNATVIHITPGKLRRGGKHMAMLKQLLKPDDVNSDSEKSESPTNPIKVVLPKKRITTKKMAGNIKEMEEKINELKKQVSKPEEKSNNKPEEKTNKQEKKVNKSQDQTKKIEDDIIGRKFNSNVTKVQCPILKELEIKRRRIIAELKKDSTSKPKPKQERKARPRRKIETSTRVTRSKINTGKKTDDNKKIEVIEEKQKQPIKQRQSAKQKTTTLKRNASIEDVAARLRKDKDKHDPPENENIIDVTNQKPILKLDDKKMRALFSPNSSIDSCDSMYVRERGMTPGTTEDEEIPRLHISSDEEMDETFHISNDADDPDIVKGLKERGIHLIPNKFSYKKSIEPLKDEDNPNVINTQHLQLNITAVDISEQSFDIEDSIPQNKIEKRIEIKSDVYLDESKKIDVWKILSQSITTDTILGQDNKMAAKIKDKIEFRKEEIKKLPIKDKEITKDSEIRKGEAEEPKEIIKEEIKIVPIKAQETTKDLEIRKEEAEEPKEMIKEEIKKILINDKEITKDVETRKEEPEEPKEIETMEPITVIDLPKEMEKSKEIDETNTKLEMSKEQDTPKRTEKENQLAISQINTVDPVTVEYDDEFDEELFHVKIVTEDSPEYIQIVHDKSAIITKTIDDYNFGVLKKQISAKVFLEELNIEQDRVLSVTPFIELATFPAKVPKIILKPLDILYNEICDESSVDTVIDEPTKSKSKADKSNKNQTKSQKAKTSNETDKKENQKNKSSQPKSDTNINTPKVATKKTISLEQYKNKQCKKTKELEDKVIKKIKEDCDDKKMEVNSEEDSLYTLAVTGNEKPTKKETPALDSNSKKRKAEADSTKPTSEKRIKPNEKQSLLKTVKTLDVDHFLSMLHGPSNRAS